MGWESRAGTGRYYTRSMRVNGRIVREYIGTGPVAELAYQMDVDQRLERELERKAFEAVQNRDNALDAKLDEFSELAETLSRGLLIAAGYHQHKRGQWRKRREQERSV
jgi:hypothetical protein